MTDAENTKILLELRNELRNLNSRFDHVEMRLDQVDARLARVDACLDKVESRLDQVEIGMEKVNAYRQGTQWVVNLAFSLIVATTIGIILRFVFGS